MSKNVVTLKSGQRSLKSAYDYLLTFYSNYGSISCRFQWLKWFCEAGCSHDEARLEQTPYPFQPH